MPYITEEDLSELHKNIDFKEAQSSKLEEQLIIVKEDREKEKKDKGVLLGIAIGLLALLILGIVLFFTIGRTNTTQEQEGMYVLSEEEYQQLVNSSNDTVATTTDVVYEQESISDQVVYAVQLGAFQDKKISLYSDSFIQFKEVLDDEFYKYTMGAFETLEEAQVFRKEIVRLGFKDTFIASYNNGERLAIEEAY